MCPLVTEEKRVGEVIKSLGNSESDKDSDTEGEFRI